MASKKKADKLAVKKSNRPKNFASDKEWHDSQAWERGEAIECSADTSK